MPWPYRIVQSILGLVMAGFAMVPLCGMADGLFQEFTGDGPVVLFMILGMALWIQLFGNGVELIYEAMRGEWSSDDA
jgi:hypothetical protein